MSVDRTGILYKRKVNEKESCGLIIHHILYAYQYETDNDFVWKLLLEAEPRGNVAGSIWNGSWRTAADEDGDYPQDVRRTGRLQMPSMRSASWTLQGLPLLTTLTLLTSIYGIYNIYGWTNGVYTYICVIRNIYSKITLSAMSACQHWQRYQIVEW